MSKKKKAAKEEPEIEGEEAVSKKTPLLVHIIVFLLITVAAAGAGFGASMFLKATGSTVEAKALEPGEKPKTDEKDHGEEDSHAKADGDKEHAEGITQAYATPLPPILTNLAAPEKIWVRIELAVVAKGKMPDELLEKIHQDLFAYIRTVKLHHIEGPSGFINLKAELTDRASTRSGGAVKMVLVRTLVIE